MRTKVIVSFLVALVLAMAAIIAACAAKPLFEVASLTISPDEVVPGQEVTVSATVENVGQGEGIYSVTLTVDGEIVDTQAVSLSSGSSETVSFVLVKDEVGTYGVEIDGLKGILKVIEPVALLEVSSLDVTPALVLPGQEAKVEAGVANVGEGKGTLTVTLAVNGVETDTRLMTLAAGASDKVSFTVIRDLAGSYDLSINGVSATLTVAEVETYSSEDYLYSISYPSGWILDDSTPDSVGVVKVDIAGVGVDIDILPVAASLDELYALKVEELREELRPVAKKRVINTLILDKVAEEEKVEITSPEVDNKVEEILGDAKDKEKMRRFLALPQVRESIGESLRSQKTMDWLVQLVSGDQEETKEHSALS